MHWVVSFPSIRRGGVVATFRFPLVPQPPLHLGLNRRSQYSEELIT